MFDLKRVDSKFVQKFNSLVKYCLTGKALNFPEVVFFERRRSVGTTGPGAGRRGGAAGRDAEPPQEAVPRDHGRAARPGGHVGHCSVQPSRRNVPTRPSRRY